ncbi:MAG TPA: inorganic phosphate transporter [Anaerolineae bacterium]|jgi:PiT family inorganic phosphate transporter|nr:inorganic phosphate transporter [Anaerolineae bacterium]
MTVPAAFALLFAAAMVFGFLDGFHNSANVVATVISSRAMRPRQALSVAAVAEFAGPFLFGTAVAKTFGADLVDPQAISVAVIMAAMLAAITWKMITWYFGLPSSSSHSLFGGLIGAVIVGAGVEALIPSGLRKIVLALLLSPPLGLVGGYLVMQLTLLVTSRATPGINTFFKRGQWFTSIGLALTHGSNNAQKVMGILGLGLLSSGLSEEVSSPLWITASAAGALALGTFFGGSRVMRTIGGRFYKIRPVHGFTAQATTSTIILGATLLGGPVSTTQVVSSTIVGVGAAERLGKVRWGVFQDIAVAWLVTIPATGLLAAAFFFPMKWLMEWLA